MASLIDLRRRIRSVKNTQQITKAMKMVAAARLRRAQDKILGTRPYALELQRVIRNLASLKSGEAAHPMLEMRDEKKVLLAVVTGDKGLCGAFNSNVLRKADSTLPELQASANDGVDLLLLGRRGADYYKRRSWPIKEEHRNLFTEVRYEDAASIAEDASRAFLEGEYDAVYVIYNQFVTVLSQNLTLEKILPVVPADPDTDESAAASARDYLYEPSPERILGELLPRFITFQFYRVLLESQAAEHGARMTAMDSATKNAGELIDSLTMTYNRSRQAAITTELIEVVSGANALEG